MGKIPSRRVLRWEIPIDDEWHMIAAGPVVHVSCDRMRRDAMEVWTLSDSAEPAQAVRVFGTGHPIPDGASYEGTAMSPDKTFVWHLFGKGTA